MPATYLKLSLKQPSNVLVSHLRPINIRTPFSPLIDLDIEQLNLAQRPESTKSLTRLNMILWSLLQRKLSQPKNTQWDLLSCSDESEGYMCFLVLWKLFWRQPARCWLRFCLVHKKMLFWWTSRRRRKKKSDLCCKLRSLCVFTCITFFWLQHVHCKVKYFRSQKAKPPCKPRCF